MKMPFSSEDKVIIKHYRLDKGYSRTCSKKVTLRDIAKTEKSQMFVLFENEASYEDFFARKCFKSCYGYFV